MNVKHIIGLAAIVLGGMTSCSNILEEEGVANTITKGETGELRLNLVTDGTFNVTTKVENETKTDEQIIAETLEKINKEDFTINGQGKIVTETGSTDDVSFNHPASYFTNGGTVPAGTYTVTADKNFDTENKKIDFGIPHFQGKITNVTVEANNSKTQTITVQLINSIISVNTNAFKKLQNDANITDLYVEDPDNSQTIYDLLETDKSLMGLSDLNKILFVNPIVTSVNMVIKGTIDNGTKKFSNTRKIDLTYEEGKPKNYSVKYSISKENGTLGLNIEVNGAVDRKEFLETIDPYKPTQSQE